MSPTLGENFPHHLREDYARRCIQVGNVLRLFQTATIPPKVKRFVIVGVAQDVGKVAIAYINSKSFGPAKKYELPLLAEGRPYIDRDCFLDCSAIIEEEISNIIMKISAETEAHLDKFTKEDMVKAKAIIARCPKHPQKLLKRYNLV